jgi:hypothetical protein
MDVRLEGLEGHIELVVEKKAARSRASMETPPFSGIAKASLSGRTGPLRAGPVLPALLFSCRAADPSRATS